MSYAVLVHYVYEVLGDSRCRVYEADIPVRRDGGCHFFHAFKQKRVVRTAEHYGVGPCFKERGKACLYCGFGFLSCKNPVFNKLDKSFSYMFGNFYPV